MSTQTPEAPLLTPSQPDKQPGTPNKKSRKGLRTTAIIGGSALLLAGGTALGLSIFKGPEHQENTSHSSDPNTTPTASPNKGGLTAETPTPASVEIPAGLPADQLAKLFVEKRLSSWLDAGMNNATVYKDFQNRTSLDNTVFTDKIAAENAAVYETMFVPYDKDSPVAETVGIYQKENSTLLDDWLLTYDSGDKGDKQVYTNSITLDDGSAKLTPGSDASTEVLTFVATTHNNSAENRIGSYYDPAQIADNGKKIDGTVTFTKVGDKLEISNLDLQQQ
jgi:hypothetical protein